MAKFMLECPKCNSLNTASTFIFSKKLIQCGTCGEEINVKQSRVTSKKCTNCGKVIKSGNNTILLKKFFIYMGVLVLLYASLEESYYQHLFLP